MGYSHVWACQIRVTVFARVQHMVLPNCPSSLKQNFLASCVAGQSSGILDDAQLNDTQIATIPRSGQDRIQMPLFLSSIFVFQTL